MPSKQTIDDFLSQNSLAIVGVSRSGKGFGNTVLRELLANGFRVFPVHPEAQSVQGLACSPSLAALPEPVGGLVIVVPPKQTEIVVREAAAAGIRRVWIQPGAKSKEALQFCADSGISAISGECILMFLAKGPAIHRIHRGIRKLFGTLPR
jgi:uncharacterized protein